MVGTYLSAWSISFFNNAVCAGAEGPMERVFGSARGLVSFNLSRTLEAAKRSGGTAGR